MHATLTAVYEKDGDWWVAYVPEIPGVITQGKTLEEAEYMLDEALKLVLETNREMAETDKAKDHSGTEVRKQTIRLTAS